MANDVQQRSYSVYSTNTSCQVIIVKNWSGTGNYASLESCMALETKVSIVIVS